MASVSLIDVHRYSVCVHVTVPANATIFMISPDLTSCLMIRTCSCVSCNLSAADLNGKKSSHTTAGGVGCGPGVWSVGLGKSLMILESCSSRKYLYSTQRRD